MDMKLKITALAFLCCMSMANAKVELPGIIGDGMVLQRNTETALWGKASPFANVKIKASWSKEKVSAQAGADGKWSVRISTPNAGGPYSIEFNDGEKLTVNNIMIGDVWFCSGQSNMEMPMKGFQTQPVEGSAEVILQAKPEIPVRICQVARNTALIPQEEGVAIWKTNTPENVAGTSATAYFFAKKIQEITSIPVGIIISSWGGTPIQAWMDKGTLEKFPEFDLTFVEYGQMPAKPQNAPTTLFNGMVAPFTKFSIKGFLWYQGEANRNKAAQYRTLQPEYVKMMRGYWNNDNLPFYYVQIAPFIYDGVNGTSSAKLREAQMQNLQDIPNSGMAVTLDIGDAGCIHPAKKKEVGERLAYMALANDYGIKGIDPYSPVYQSWRMDGKRILVKFKVGPDGLAPLGQVLEGFEVAGEDKVFHPATAKVLRDEAGSLVEVFCEEVTKPAAVRYGFRNVAEGTLFNCYGIPASSFRTDNWE